MSPAMASPLRSRTTPAPQRKEGGRPEHGRCSSGAFSPDPGLLILLDLGVPARLPLTFGRFAPLLPGQAGASLVQKEQPDDPEHCDQEPPGCYAIEDQRGG